MKLTTLFFIISISALTHAYTEITGKVYLETPSCMLVEFGGEPCIQFYPDAGGIMFFTGYKDFTVSENEEGQIAIQIEGVLSSPITWFDGERITVFATEFSAHGGDIKNGGYIEEIIGYSR